MAKKSLKVGKKAASRSSPDSDLPVYQKDWPAAVPEGDDVPVDAQKVRTADLKRSVDQMAAHAHHSDEALAVAGLTGVGDPKLIAAIAAVPSDGAHGHVGTVTAARIAAVVASYKK